jgi:hypothetical protein
MSFLETPAPASAASVWARLDEQQRKAVVPARARLIAKAIDSGDATDGKEQSDE